MAQPKLTDNAWQYCKMIGNNRNHVCCNFCGHTMWGGITRFKEHLAQKKGDVAPCTGCPPEVTIEMQSRLIELSRERENKHRRKRETLEDLRKDKVQKLLAPQPPQEVNVAELEAREKTLLDQAIKESLHTHEMEVKKAKYEEEEFQAACNASARLYELESRMYGESASAYRAGPSTSNAGASTSRVWTSDSGSDFLVDLESRPVHESNLNN